MPAWRCVYSNPAAEGSLSIVVTSQPAFLKASRVRNRWPDQACAGTPTATSSGSDFLTRDTDEPVRTQSATWARKRVSTSMSSTSR